MNNTKFKILVTAGFMILSLFTVTGCNTPSGEETPAHEHSYDWHTVKAATCTEDGTEEGTCACGDKTTRTVDKKGHTDANGDYDCDDCNYDLTPADWVEPTFEFEKDVEGRSFLALNGTLRRPRESNRVPFDGSLYCVAVPIIDSETGKMKFSDRSYEWKNVTAECDYFYFIDPEIDNKSNCYVIYDEIKSACNEAHIKMDSERFKKLYLEFKNIVDMYYAE